MALPVALTVVRPVARPVALPVVRCGAARSVVQEGHLSCPTGPSCVLTSIALWWSSGTVPALLDAAASFLVAWATLYARVLRLPGEILLCGLLRRPSCSSRYAGIAAVRVVWLSLACECFRLLPGLCLIPGLIGGAASFPVDGAAVRCLCRELWSVSRDVLVPVCSVVPFFRLPCGGVSLGWADILGKRGCRRLGCWAGARASGEVGGPEPRARGVW